MKTIEELYNEVIANEDLKEEFIKAFEENKVEEFMKKNGCDATMEDLKQFASEEIPLSEDELDNAAGGGSACNDRVIVGSPEDVALSLGTLGLGCIVAATISTEEAVSIEYPTGTSEICDN